MRAVAGWKGQAVTLVSTGGQRLEGEVDEARGNFVAIVLHGGRSVVEVDVRTARPSKRCRDLADPGAWQVEPADALRLGWGAEAGNAKLLPTWKYERRVAPDNPAAPTDVCAGCGHTAVEHGARLPSPCRHGSGPVPTEIRTPADMALFNASLVKGCRCTGFRMPEGAKET